MGEVAAFGPVYSSGVLHFPNRLHENLLCRDQAIGPGWAGTMIRHTLLEAIEDEELWVEIMTGVCADKLLLDESGTISGLAAKDAGGEIEIRAKAVILATGGFGRSDEKLQKYFGFFDCETPIHRFSVPGDTGDAIDMLEDLGVSPPKERMNVSIFGPAHHPFNYCILRVMEHPSCLSVNLDGKRWQNEENGLFGGRFTIHKQPKEIAWGIFSEKRAHEVAKSYIADPAYRDEAWIYESFKEDFEEEIALSPFAPVRRADSIEALAEAIGAPPRALAETVKKYNEYCENGCDQEFGKDPKHLMPLGEGPYLAIYGQRFSEAAFGGVRVTPKCEATREDGTRIPGLYAVGDATSAMHVRGELAAISELTWATASAWLSGGYAADYAKSYTKVAKELRVRSN
jgi:fumarate reductase flavoprotein subunit